MARQLRALVTAALPIALLLTGCGSSNSAAPTATAAPPTAAATTAPPTAMRIVVTATAGPATAGQPTVVRVTVVVTATPRPSATPKPGGSTPLPGASPVPTAPGLILGMITRPATDVSAVQAGANRHDKRYTFYLKPEEVIKRTLPRYGFKRPVDVVAPPKPIKSYSGRPVRKAVVKYKGQLYLIDVTQPSVRGPKGVWVIVTILRQHFRIGQISRPVSVVNRLQTGANAGKKNFVFYRNPTKVVQKTLADYGFDPAHTKIVRNATPVTSTTGRPLDLVVVNYYDTLYDVYLAQPGVRGSKGVWVIVTIAQA